MFPLSPVKAISEACPLQLSPDGARGLLLTHGTDSRRNRDDGDGHQR